MKYLLPLLFLLLPATVFASNQAIMTTFGGALVTPGTASYAAVGGAGATAASSATTLEPDIPYNATIQNMTAVLSGAPGTGFSYTMTLFVNGIASALTCTVSNLATTCSDSNDKIAVTAGESVFWKQLSSSASANPVAISVVADIIPVNARDTWIPALSGTENATTETYSALINRALMSTTLGAATAISPIPALGTIDQLYTSGATASPGSYLISFMQANATTSLACTRSATACSDTTDAVNIASLDEQDSVSYFPSASPATSVNSYSVRYTPPLSTPNNYLIFGGSTGADSSATTFYYPVQATSVGTTTESGVQEVSNAETITRFSMVLVTAPGAGKTRTLTLRDNGVNTALSCSITGAGTTACNAAGFVSVAAGDLLSISDAPTGTPATSNGNRWSFVANEIPNNVFGFFQGSGFLYGRGYIL